MGYINGGFEEPSETLVKFSPPREKYIADLYTQRGIYTLPVHQVLQVDSRQYCSASQNYHIHRRNKSKSLTGKRFAQIIAALVSLLCVTVIVYCLCK